MRPIRNHWNETIQEIKEFQVIADIEDKEIGAIQESINDLINDQFVQTSTEKGIARWERILRISPLSNDSLEIRRERVNSKLSNYRPYNKSWLYNKLDAVLGVGRHQHKVKDNILTIKTSADEIEAIKSLRKDLRREIPCNIDINVGLERLSAYQMHVGTIARVGKITTIIPSTHIEIRVKNDNEMLVGAFVRTAKKVMIEVRDNGEF